MNNIFTQPMKENTEDKAKRVAVITTAVGAAGAIIGAGCGIIFKTICKVNSMTK